MVGKRTHQNIQILLAVIWRAATGWPVAAAGQMTDLSWDESTPSVLEKRPGDSRRTSNTALQDGLETIE
jgi:hypothetical protein